MKIRQSFINELELLKVPRAGEGGEGGALLAPYMEYPEPKKVCKYVMQWHTRGRSVHTDWRMEVNDHLVGWTVLTPGGIPKAISTLEESKKITSHHKFEFSAENKNRGFRAETKARQPKIWLTVEGVVKPGEVGATKEHPGVLDIIDKGQVIFGTQKPYFHEYFLKGAKENGPFFGDWTRVVVRAVNVQVIDPETKKPKKGKELMWRVLVPSDQEPYAISNRAMKKKWKPPKDYPEPFPVEWTKKNFLEQYKKWYDWMVSGDKHEKETESSANEFTVQYLSYIGQIVTRGIPNQRWFLRLQDGDKILSWESEFDFTRFSPLPLSYEGQVEKKWFDFEGDVPPNTKYNPSKTLTGKISVLDKGTYTKIEEEIEGAKILNINFKGKELKGKYVLTQEEKDAPIFTIEKLSEELDKANFVLQLHEIETSEGVKKHWDIRIDKGFEFNLYLDPLTLTKEGDSTKAVYKTCRDIEKWMQVKESRTKMMVGNLVTFVTPIDSGTVNLIDTSPPMFLSMEFNGEKLKGYFVYRERDGAGMFERAKIPHALSKDGNPKTGSFYDPFKKIQKQGWDYFWLEIYDQKAFSRCVINPEKYLPDLTRPQEVQEILVCLYPRPGTIHGARVSRIKFSDKWTVEQATSWIKKNKLDTWAGELIREKRKESLSVEDEALIKIVENEIRRQELNSPKIDEELKKKKLELINRWLEANKHENIQ